MSKPKKEFPTVWPEGPELRLVNRETFDPTTSMQILNWQGVNPITSGIAIRERQDTLKLLISSKELRAFINKKSFNGIAGYGRDFFTTHGSNSKFAKNTELLIKHLANAVIETRAQLTTDLYDRVVEKLAVDFEEAKRAEDVLLGSLAPELEKIYNYTGTGKYLVRHNHEKELTTERVVKGYGYREYAFHEISNRVVDTSRALIEYMKRDTTKLSKPARFIVNVGKLIAAVPYVVATGVMSFVEKYQTDVLYTTRVPNQVRKELDEVNSEFYMSVVNCFKTSLLRLEMDSSLIDKAIQAVKVQTEFQYVLNSKSGFRVRIVDAQVSFDNDYLFREAHLMSADKAMLKDVYAEAATFEAGVSWYSALQHFLITRKTKRIASQAAKKALMLPLRTAFEQALAESSRLMGTGENTFLRASSGRSKNYELLMDEVKYVNVQNAVQGMNLVQDLVAIEQFRAAVCKLVSELRWCADLAERVITAKEKYSELPFCFPDVLADDKNMVSFNNLAPVHLIGRKNTAGTSDIQPGDLRLIAGLPALNGRIVSITGQNGGGKTATEVEMINALYQAHAGLPVFAEHFSFNPKDVIAMVFVERGQGSMLELLMKKLTVVAEEVNNNPTNKIVVVLDELLTGTQEDAGLEIGQQYLDMLASKGCSVMFVTQITSLAHYAERKLNALCYYFDKEGNLVPGIGKGNAQHLAKQVGLDRYLVNP